MASEVRWIKITTDMFDNKKIKHLRRLPHGNDFVLIWVMLLTMAGRCNAGGMVFLTENIPFTPLMLAHELCFDEAVISEALRNFEELGMIFTNEDSFLQVEGWEEHQNAEGLEKIREQNRIRKQKQRERERDVLSRDQSRDGHAQEREKEKDIIYAPVIAFLNEQAGTKYKATTQKTKTCINARVAEGFTLADFKTVIAKKCASWKGTDMARYLRPETLFGPKFESYLNEPPVGGIVQDGQSVAESTGYVLAPFEDPFEADMRDPEKRKAAGYD